MAIVNKKTGFIGAGNMAEAFIGAVTRAGIIPAPMIYASDFNQERLNTLKKTHGISVTEDNFRIFSMCDIVILAVKPQHMPDVLSRITSSGE